LAALVLIGPVGCTFIENNSSGGGLTPVGKIVAGPLPDGDADSGVTIEAGEDVPDEIEVTPGQQVHVTIVFNVPQGEDVAAVLVFFVGADHHTRIPVDDAGRDEGTLVVPVVLDSSTCQGLTGTHRLTLRLAVETASGRVSLALELVVVLRCPGGGEDGEEPGDACEALMSRLYECFPGDSAVESERRRCAGYLEEAPNEECLRLRVESLRCQAGMSCDELNSYDGPRWCPDHDPCSCEAEIEAAGCGEEPNGEPCAVDETGPCEDFTGTFAVTEVGDSCPQRVHRKLGGTRFSFTSHGDCTVSGTQVKEPTEDYDGLNCWFASKIPGCPVVTAVGNHLDSGDGDFTKCGTTILLTFGPDCSVVLRWESAATVDHDCDC